MQRSRLCLVHEPSLVAVAPNLLIVACADGFVRTYPSGSVGTNAEPISEFETVYPSVTSLKYCAIHDTIVTIEKRRGDDTGVVRVYYNWRLGACPSRASSDGNATCDISQPSLEPTTPFPPSKRCGVPARVYPISSELSVYRLTIGASAVAVACCESTGRLVVASGRGHVSLWEVHPPYRCPPTKVPPCSWDCCQLAAVQLWLPVGLL